MTAVQNNRIRQSALLAALCLLGAMSLNAQTLVTATHLLTNSSSTNATSYATASFTPSANKLILAAIRNHFASNPPTTPTMTGNGLTWAQVATRVFTTGGNQRITVFRAMGSSPSSGAATIDFAGNTQNNCSWSINEFNNVDQTGSNGSGAVVQSATNNATGSSLTVTLAAFGSANNATYGAFGEVDNDTLTQGSGFTRQAETHAADGGSGTDYGLMTEFKNTNDTSVDATAGLVTFMGGVAVEIKQAEATRPSLYYFRMMTQ